MRSIRFLPLLATLLVACNDSTAPDASASIELPPFSVQVMQVAPNSTDCLRYDWCSYFNGLKLFVPSGVDPLVDVSVKDVGPNSPQVLVTFVRRVPDPENVCAAGCSMTPWDIEVGFHVVKEGSADVTLSLHSDPTKQTTFRVISSIGNGGKG